MFYFDERQSVSNPYPVGMLKNTTVSPLTLTSFCMTCVIASLLMYMIIAMKVITRAIKDWRYGPTLPPTTTCETESEDEEEVLPNKTPTLEDVLSSGRGCGC